MTNFCTKAFTQYGNLSNKFNRCRLSDDHFEKLLNRVEKRFNCIAIVQSSIHSTAIILNVNNYIDTRIGQFKISSSKTAL